MNRDDLIRAVAAACEEPLGIVEQIVDTALDAIVEEIGAGRSVNLDGFGNFFLRPAAAKVAPHPRAGEPVEHPAYTQIAFRASGAWRSRINGGRDRPAVIVELRP